VSVVHSARAGAALGAAVVGAGACVAFGPVLDVGSADARSAGGGAALGNALALGVAGELAGGGMSRRDGVHAANALSAKTWNRIRTSRS
jgi:hypothetical protein